MKNDTKYTSFRRSLFTTIGVLLLVFGVAIFSISWFSMTYILENVERTYLQDQMEQTERAWAEENQQLQQLAAAIARWDADVPFGGGAVDSEGEQYINTLLEGHFYTAVLLQDEQGRLFYQGNAAGASALSGAAADHFSALAILEGREPAGVVFFEETPYFVATAPVYPANGGGRSLGSVTLVNLLDSAYFQRIMHSAHYTYELRPRLESVGEERYELSHAGTTVTLAAQMADMNGNAMALRMQGDRQAYQDGQPIMWRTLGGLLLCTALFLAVLLYVMTKRALRPIEKLEEDIHALPAAGRFDPEAYSKTREFVSLGNALNAMLRRLDRSQHSAEVFENILKGMPVMIAVTEPEGDALLYANQAMRERFGIAEADIGKPWRAMKETRPGGASYAPQGEADLIVWDEEEKEGEGRRVYQNTLRLIRWFDRSGAHLYIRRDITEDVEAQRSMERRLRQTEIMSEIASGYISAGNMDAFVQHVLRISGEFIGASRTLITHFNEALGKVELAYEWHSEAEGLTAIGAKFKPFADGHPIYEAIVRDRRPYVAVDSMENIKTVSPMLRDGMKSFLALPVMVSGEMWGILNVGMTGKTHAWTESDVHLFQMIASIISAVVERVASEKALLRMSSIVDSSPNCIGLFGRQGQIEYLNQGTERITGYSTADLLKGSLEPMLGSETRRRLLDTELAEVLRAGFRSFEMPFFKNDGERRVMDVTAFAVGKDQSGVAVIGTDITERIRMEEDLRDAKLQAENSSRAKGDFLSRMSHEMRTPMNAIIGMTHIAKTTQDVDKKEYCLDKIDEASTHLLGVINDILDMSKIEANKFTLSDSEFSFERMLQKVTNIINFRVEEKKQNFILNLDPGIPAVLVADEQRLTQVITNLLSNAVKFTPEEGTITLDARLLEEADGNCTLQVSVTDTGIGISKEQQRRLFQSFEQADGGVSRKFGGTGLGLAISKSIVEMMQGRIWVESREGHGASFIFTVQAQRGSAAQILAADATFDFHTLRVLVVDDASAVQNYFENLAETIGFRCVTAQSGREACDILSRDTAFDLAFIDWKMPGMDGVELTDCVRRRFQLKAPVIMISGMDWEAIETEARGAGVNKFITKPLFASQVVDSMMETLGHRQAQAPVDKAVRKAYAYDGLHLLLAEDVEINREIVLSLLEDTGIIIDTAENGRIALRKFEESPGLYDMILMDIHMPEMDGYEATRQIRRLPVPEAKTVPIVAMTANVFREDIERCMAAGMNDHIGKPIDLDEFYQKLSRHIRREER